MGKMDTDPLHIRPAPPRQGRTSPAAASGRAAPPAARPAAPATPREISLDSRIDRFFAGVRDLGVSALIYDYTADHRDAGGAILPPAVMKVRNLDPEMIGRWCGGGYARVDPVQAVAVNSVAPFLWSYDADATEISASYLTLASRPVVEFISASGFVNGITVPIHLPGGGYVTVNGLWNGPGRSFPGVASGVIAPFALLAQAFQNEIGATAAMLRPPAAPSPVAPPSLTARERECLLHAAEGLSAKEISRLIERSVPTVVMHLNSAVRKLGARNRSHAVAEALRQNLL